MLNPYHCIPNTRTCPSWGVTQQLRMSLAAKRPSPATSSSALCSSSAGTNPRALPSRNQPTEGVCCSLLALDTFRIEGFLFFKPHRGDSCTHRVNCNESPLGSSSPPARPAPLAALCPGIYSTVNFERVQRAGKTRWGRGDGPGRAGGCRGFWPRLQQSNPDNPPAHPGPLCPTHPLAGRLRGTPAGGPL